MRIVVLNIDLTRRLPDIDRAPSIPADFEQYGRCAILRTGSYWFSRENSSHPPSTKEGFYWAYEEKRSDSGLRKTGGFRN